MKWPITTIGNVCRVIPGFAFKSRDWSTSGIPVVKIKNIREGCTVDLADCDHVPSDLLTARLSKFTMADGDILLAMTGATAGKVGRLRTKVPVLLNQRVAKIAPLPDKADSLFVWAVVSSEWYQKLFFRLADGAAQPNMSGGQIESVEIPYPPQPVQRRIASILSAYDDLIENNTRRIAILQEMARRIYEEWFVRFRFPGHEGVRMVESELGLVPDGWRCVILKDVARVNQCSIKRNNEPDQIVYVDISSVSTGSVDKREPMAYATAPGRARRIVNDGDII
jgi:type I restriction enzyme S subunit